MTGLSANTANNRRQPTIGELVSIVSILVPVRTPDGAGGTSVSYVLEAQVWGDIRTASGETRIDADRRAARLNHAVWLRWRPGLTIDHRFASSGRIFEIRAILDHDGRRRFLQCECVEFVS